MAVGELTEKPTIKKKLTGAKVTCERKIRRIQRALEILNDKPEVNEAMDMMLSTPAANELLGIMNELKM